MRSGIFVCQFIKGNESTLIITCCNYFCSSCYISIFVTLFHLEIKFFFRWTSCQILGCCQLNLCVGICDCLVIKCNVFCIWYRVVGICLLSICYCSLKRNFSVFYSLSNGYSYKIAWCIILDSWFRIILVLCNLVIMRSLVCVCVSRECKLTSVIIGYWLWCFTFKCITWCICLNDVKAILTSFGHFLSIQCLHTF